MLGMSPPFNDAVALLYVEQKELMLTRWSVFFTEQCGNCSLNPTECPFFDPPPQRVVGRGDISAEVKEANIVAVSLGRLGTCPVKAE